MDFYIGPFRRLDRERVPREVEEELQFHLDLLTEEHCRQNIPWEQAQAAYLSLSRKLGDAVQGELTQRFKGSPANADTAFVRQLRTTAAPAIAVEISSVTIQDKADLDRMLPGVAEAVVRGVVAFRPTYVTPTVPGIAPGT